MSSEWQGDERDGFDSNSPFIKQWAGGGWEVADRDIIHQEKANSKLASRRNIGVKVVLNGMGKGGGGGGGT